MIIISGVFLLFFNRLISSFDVFRFSGKFLFDFKTSQILNEIDKKNCCSNKKIKNFNALSMRYFSFHSKGDRKFHSFQEN